MIKRLEIFFFFVHVLGIKPVDVGGKETESQGFRS